RLDRAGDESTTQLFVYDVKNIKSVDLADYLNQIFLGSSSSGGSRRTSTSGGVAPGLSPATVGGAGGFGRMSSRSSRRNAQSAAPAAQPGAPAAPAASGAAPGGANSDMRITAIEENNQILVMATPFEWDAMQSA